MRNYKKAPLVFQMEATECGAASFAMILAYWGKYIPLEQLRVATGVSRDGCNAGNIMRAAKKLGLECHGYRREPEALRDMEMPCIIHWNFNHFVVLDGFKGNYAYLNDPAIGRRRLTLDELDEGFTGVVLTFKPTEAFEKEKKKNTLFPLIRQRLAGLWSPIVQLVFSGLLLVMPGLILPVLSQLFLDRILGAGNVPWFGQFLAFMAATVLFQVLLTLQRALVLQRLQTRLILVSARDFLRHLFRLPINFFDQRYAGDLAGRVESNNSVNAFLTGSLTETVLNLFVAVFYLVLLLIYNPVLTVIGSIGIVVNVVVARLTSCAIANKVVKLQQDKGSLMGAVCAGLSITSTIKASGAEGSYTARLLGYEAKTSSQEQAVSCVQTVAGAIPSVVSALVDVALLVAGAHFVIQGSMTLGMLFAFTTLFSSFSQPVEALVGFIQSIQTLKADMARVDDVLRYPLDESFQNVERQTPHVAKLSGQITCEDLSFGYSQLAKPIVEGFGFSLESGSSVAFVGSSGCGKSTVGKLISGLYQPWSGSITLDGIPMREIPPDVLHASVSTVSQHITLFSGTIRENLTMWNPAILEQDMINAAKDACIHETIAQKPGAYDFKLTEGGTNLSGGQRQRLEIARALITNPTILIMDEATSALDPIVEKEILNNIKRRGCTCIIVAHRLSAVRDCDQIIVMYAGKIAQRGRHDELAAQEGFYRDFMSAN